MIPTTINGQPAYLLDAEPDWTSPFVADFGLGAVVEPGLTGREIRRPVSTYLRVRGSFTATVTGAQARRIANAFRAYQGQKVAVPLWGCAEQWSQVRVPAVTGGLNLALREGWALWAIYSDTQPAWLMEADRVVPLVVGRLERRELRWITPDAAEINVSFAESSPASLAVSASEVAFDPGPYPSDAYNTPPRMFPLDADFDGPTDSWSVSIIRDEIGFGREPLETIYPQTNAFAQDADRTAIGRDQIGALIRFFQEHATGRGFWINESGSCSRVTAPVGTLSVAVPVDSTEGLESGQWLSFWDGTTRHAKVSSLNPSALFLESAIGEIREEAVVTKLRLVRFQRPRLTVQWRSGNVASCRLSVVEVPPEYVPPEGEDLGITLGLSWHRVYLYEIGQDRPSGPFVERLTSHEEDVELGGLTYAAKRITHGEIARGIALDRDNVTVRADSVASVLLTSLAALRSLGPIRVKIMEASVTVIPQFSEAFAEDYQ